MTLFSYRARQQDGVVKEGTIDAVDLDSAHAALSHMGLTVDELHASTLTEQQTFTPSPPSEVSQDWSVDDSGNSIDAGVISPQDSSSTYYPFMDTVRLYVGWMLAWYFLIYAFGSYQSLRELSFEIPLVSGLYLSPLVLSFTFACYLVLLLSEFRVRGKLKGLLVGVLGIAIFSLFRKLS